MTTTLHGLVTISELFADFNFINTGVGNCLIMCQNARKMHHSEAKKSPNLSPIPIEECPGPNPTLLGACGGASILAPSALDLPHSNENPGSVSGVASNQIKSKRKY